MVHKNCFDKQEKPRTYLKVPSYKLKKHWQMVAYVFQKYPEI